MAIMQLGIFRDYWGDFADNTWAVHVHYWLVTLWFLFLITQPRLYAKGRLQSHRSWGLVGLMIAGATAFTGINQLNRDLVYANFVRDNPGQIGPFEPWFFYGIMCVEIILVSAFLLAVLMAIRHRKNLRDHALWLTSTAFIMLMPALGRGIQGLWIARYGVTPETTIVVMPPLYMTQLLIIGLILTFAWRLRALTHPATLLALGANGCAFLLEPMGRSVTLQTLLSTLVKA